VGLDKLPADPPATVTALPTPCLRTGQNKGNFFYNFLKSIVFFKKLLVLKQN
jgi:hypothetical protein